MEKVIIRLLMKEWVKDNRKTVKKLKKIVLSWDFS